MKSLTESERKKLLSSYHRRESRNYHTENAIALINRFGTTAGKKQAKKLHVKIKKQGYITYKQQNWFYKHGHKHYSKLIKPVKKIRRK